MHTLGDTDNLCKYKIGRLAGQVQSEACANFRADVPPGGLDGWGGCGNGQEGAAALGPGLKPGLNRSKQRKQSAPAKVVARAEDYRWSSLWVRSHGTPEQKSILSPWRTGRPTEWLQRVNAVLTPKERGAWRLSLETSRPFGGDAWTMKLVSQLGLEHTSGREGRPKRETSEVES